MDPRAIIGGGIITIVIGGSSFAVSQSDILDNFAEETNMSQQEAEEYIEESQDQNASFTTVGEDHLKMGREASDAVSEIDCVNYRAQG